jgi:hypothetical protein
MKMVNLKHIIKKINNMEYLPVFALMFVVVAFISWRWVEGIDYMQKNHPDYKGEDFLDWGNDDDNENDKNQIM